MDGMELLTNDMMKQIKIGNLMQMAQEGHQQEVARVLYASVTQASSCFESNNINFHIDGRKTSVQIHNDSMEINTHITNESYFHDDGDPELHIDNKITLSKDASVYDFLKQTVKNLTDPEFLQANAHGDGKMPKIKPDLDMELATIAVSAPAANGINKEQMAILQKYCPELEPAHIMIAETWQDAMNHQDQYMAMLRQMTDDRLQMTAEADIPDVSAQTVRKSLLYKPEQQNDTAFKWKLAHVLDNGTVTLDNLIQIQTQNSSYLYDNINGRMILPANQQDSLDQIVSVILERPDPEDGKYKEYTPKIGEPLQFKIEDGTIDDGSKTRFKTSDITGIHKPQGVLTLQTRNSEYEYAYPENDSAKQMGKLSSDNRRALPHGPMEFSTGTTTLEKNNGHFQLQVKDPETNKIQLETTGIKNVSFTPDTRQIFKDNLQLMDAYSERLQKARLELDFDTLTEFSRKFEQVCNNIKQNLRDLNKQGFDREDVERMSSQCANSETRQQMSVLLTSSFSVQRDSREFGNS